MTKVQSAPIIEEMQPVEELNPVILPDFDLAGAKRSFEILPSQKKEFTFYKMVDNTMHYSINIAGVEIHLTAEPSKLPSPYSFFEYWYDEGHMGADTYYKLMFVDKPVRLGLILAAVESKTEEAIAPHYFCSKCGNYRQPMWDENPDLATFCPCEPYVD